MKFEPKSFCFVKSVQDESYGKFWFHRKFLMCSIQFNTLNTLVLNKIAAIIPDYIFKWIFVNKIVLKRIFIEVLGPFSQIYYAESSWMILIMVKHRIGINLLSKSISIPKQSWEMFYQTQFPFATKFNIFDTKKTWVTCWISRPYLTDVAAAQLWWPRSYRNMGELIELKAFTKLFS